MADMDLTPEPEIYRACAEASWEAPGTQRLWRSYQRETYVELMLARPDFCALVDVAYRAGREDEAAALARGQQPREEPWRRRTAATGGGPCPTCRRPFWTHVCLSCSPDYQTPGDGCVNCRNSGMDQTPCKPAVDSIASQHTQDGAR